MEEPIVFIPIKKHPTLIRIWLPFLLFSTFLFIISFPRPGGFFGFCIVETLVLIGQFRARFETQVIISLQDKTFQYYYINCLGEESLITINIPSVAGSYKFTKITRYSSYKWQLIIFNDRKYMATITEGRFDQYQLEEMVRIINQINKDNIESVVF
ncbi:MAG: hypothetical protein ACRYGB_00545 [Janthinobacterium lividum]